MSSASETSSTSTNESLAVENKSPQAWHCRLYAKGYVSRASFDQGEEALEVDLCQLVSNKAVLFPLLVDPMSNFMFDPKEVRGCSQESITKIYNLIQQTCKNAGFYASPSQRCCRKPTNKFLATLDFCCEYNKPCREVKRPPPLRKRSNKRPSCPENRCPFRIRVFCYRGDQCWYLYPRSVYQCENVPSLHIGHRQLDPEDIRRPIYERKKGIGKAGSS